MSDSMSRTMPEMIRMCDHCAKEFQLFPSVDGFLTNEKCPHCGEYNPVWIRVFYNSSTQRKKEVG